MRILAVSDVEDEAVAASLASKLGTIDLVTGQSAESDVGWPSSEWSLPL